MLMVHGYTGGKWYYENDMQTFSKSRRCIALDMIGHGDSDKPTDRPYSVAQYARDIEEISRILKLDRFVLVGHSMGGMVAQTYALDHNNDGRCIALILISTASELLLRDAIGASIRREVDSYERGEWQFNEQVQRAFARTAWAPDYADAHPDEVERAYREAMRVPDIVRLRLLLAMAQEFDVTDRIGEIKLPAFVCAGTKDILSKSAENLARALPNARFRKLDGPGHMINIESPQVIQKEISAFLNEAIS